MLCNVKRDGELFSWSFVANFNTTVTAVRDALNMAGYPAGIVAGDLSARNAFLRTLASWVVGTRGGETDHKMSDIIASYVDDSDPKIMKIQIDQKMIDRMGAVAEVRYAKKCAVWLGPCEQADFRG